MTKLKTLKDISIKYLDIEHTKWKIKQEAIKWVKSFENDYYERIEVKPVFMDFFNITEEDLE